MNPLRSTSQQQQGLTLASPEQQHNADSEEHGQQDVKKESQHYHRAVSVASNYAKNHMIVPAILNTPITTSLCRPLIQSQQNGQLPNLKAAFSTTGWAPSIARSFIRYMIADTTRRVSAQCIYGTKSTQELPEAAQNRANFVINSSSAAMMTLASQPFTAMQIKQQMKGQSVKALKDTKPFLQPSFKNMIKGSFRGSISNCLSTLLMFSMDTNDRQLIKAKNEGHLTDLEVKAIQFCVGGTIGLINNFLKTHANARILGRSHQEIFRQLANTASKNPRLFFVQAAYAAVMGGVANQLWGSTLSMLDHVDRKISERNITENVPEHEKI